VVTSVETFGKTMAHAEAGDNAALLLRGVRRHQVRRGQVIAAPGNLAAHQRFEARVHLLAAVEGGRRTEIRTGYRPQSDHRCGGRDGPGPGRGGQAR
jgi:elongation factor Tu